MLCCSSPGLSIKQDSALPGGFLSQLASRPEQLLNLLPSDGNHDQLSEHQFHAVLDRLETIREARAEVRCYAAVKLGHEDYAGCQTIHSASCKSLHAVQGRAKPRKVKPFGQ